MSRHRDPTQPEEGSHGLESSRVVVIAGYHHHGGHLCQLQQSPVDDLFSLGRGGRDVEHVARHQDEIDIVVSGDRGDLGQDITMLVRPADTTDGSSDMPIGCMENLHSTEGTERA